MRIWYVMFEKNSNKMSQAIAIPCFTFSFVKVIGVLGFPKAELYDLDWDVDVFTCPNSSPRISSLSRFASVLGFLLADAPMFKIMFLIDFPTNKYIHSNYTDQ